MRLRMSMYAFVFLIPNYNKVYDLFTIWNYLPLSGILFFLNQFCSIHKVLLKSYYYQNVFLS